MADNLTPSNRSYNMSRIRNKDTKPEETVRKYLFSQGFRYRKNDKRYPGRPDIVLPKYNTVIFINGCFWHKHESCSYFVWPKSNEEFWKKKIQSNVERDRQVYSQLHQMGWKVIVIWECEIRTKPKQGMRLPLLVNEIIDGGKIIGCKNDSYRR